VLDYAQHLKDLLGKKAKLCVFLTVQMSRVNLIPWPFYPNDTATLAHWTGGWMIP